MSDKLDDGGPAFPQAADRHGYPARDTTGATLRDYFAAKAMQGFIANDEDYEEVAESRGVDIYDFIAEQSYEYADAMLRARKV